MRFTVGEIHDAHMALAAIFNSPRNIPQTAKYRLSKMLTAIEKYGNAAEKRRYELIVELGAEKKDDKERSLGWQVTTENQEAYKTRLEAMRAEDAGDIAVEPITLASLGDAADGIEAHEFKMLGKLVVE